MNSFLQLSSQYTNINWYSQIETSLDLNKLFDLIISLETNLDEIIYTLTQTTNALSVNNFYL